jgi:hypothetical protein
VRITASNEVAIGLTSPLYKGNTRKCCPFLFGKFKQKGMIKINGIAFYEEPGSCGSCPFFSSGSSDLCPQDKGVCSQWRETHHSWANPPRRCKKLFKSAFRFPDGIELVIVGNND